MKVWGYRMMIMLGCFLLGGSILACQNGGNDYKLKIDYIENLAAEIGDATAIGIANLPIEDTREMAQRSIAPSSNDFARLLFSQRFLDVTTIPEGVEQKNYLVTTREDYFHGKTEYDDGSITKVTFIKNTTVTETVRDHEGNIISSTDTVTQDELPAQVNKVYVYNGFTFIQFIPVTPNNEGVLSSEGEQMIDIRPADLVLEADGTTAYDKNDYRSDEFHQSFVIDNETGFIYKIDDIWVYAMSNGLCKIRPEISSEYDPNPNTIYDYRITEDDQLEFFALIQNPTVQVFDYFKDIYGNNFIQTDSLTTYDAATNTHFFHMPYPGGSGVTVNTFVLTDQRVVLFRQGPFQYQKMGRNGTVEELLPTDFLTLKGYITVKEGMLYIVPQLGKLPEWTYGDVLYVKNLSTGQSVSIAVKYHPNATQDAYFLLSHEVLLFRNVNAFYWCKIDFSSIDFAAMNGKLIYFPDIVSHWSGVLQTDVQGSYDGSDNYPIRHMTSGWTPLAIGQNYVQTRSDNFYKYHLIGLTQTRYFEIVKVYDTEGFGLEWVERASVDAGETIRYFFQPINPLG